MRCINEHNEFCFPIIIPRVSVMWNTYGNLNIFAMDWIVDVVPYVASRSILLKTLDFCGGIWEVHIFINYNRLANKLHYCNKSRDIIMIPEFHLFCFAPCLLLAGNAKFKSVFSSLDFRFLLETPRAWISPLVFFCNALWRAFWEKNKLIYFFFSLDLIYGTSKTHECQGIKRN